MELIFNHRFGKVEQQSLIVCDVLALPDPHQQDEVDMLEAGWLALDRPHHIHGADREVFYQCRSTRIDLERANRRFPQHVLGDKPLLIKEIFPRNREDTVWTGMHQLYAHYIKRKGFRDLYDPFQHINDRDSFLVFYTGDIKDVVGFTKIKRYQWHDYYHNDDFVMPDVWRGDEGIEFKTYAIESVMHCNNQPISQLTMDMEIAWAQSQDMAYYYAGAGYERSSIYKSEWKGFEWWTGTKWSRGKREYKRLCEQDSKLRTISDLGSAK